MIYLKIISGLYMLTVLLDCLFGSHELLVGSHEKLYKTKILPAFVNFILFILVANIIDRNYEFIITQQLITRVLFELLSFFVLLVLGYKFIKPTFRSFFVFLFTILALKSKR